MLRGFLLVVLIASFWSCERDEATATPPSLSNYKVNDQLKIHKLHQQEDYILSFTASDDALLTSYRLELVKDQTEEKITVKEKQLGQRQVQMIDTFNLSAAKGVLGEGYRLSLSVFNSAGLNRTLSQEVDLKDARPKMQVSRANPFQRVSEGSSVVFEGSISDYEDLEALEIYIYREEPPSDPVMGRILREFPGTNDTLYVLNANDKIDLPQSMTIDNYFIVYRLSDSNGNGIIKVEPLYIDF